VAAPVFKLNCKPALTRQKKKPVDSTDQQEKKKRTLQQAKSPKKTQASSPTGWLIKFNYINPCRLETLDAHLVGRGIPHLGN
jgi:hypothetical protein